MAPGKFEDCSHEQLQKMVASGTPEKISAHAQTLESAAQIIAQASTYVNSVVNRLEWKGEAAQAYRSWATQFAREGQKLSDYAYTVGTALSTAGQALSETKTGMPNAGSESAWREEAAASPGAEVSRERARQEAIQRLERLDSYYSVASEQIREVKEPTFKVDPETLPPPPAGGGAEALQPSNPSAATGALTAQPAIGSPSQTSPESSNFPSQAQRPQPNVVPQAPLTDSQVGTDLGSAGAVTDTRPSTPGSLPTQSGPSGGTPTPNSPVPGGPGVFPPPATSRPVGTATGYQPPGTSTNTPTGATGTGPRPSQPPASPGIHGGRAKYLPTPPTQAGMARGTVIGAEPAQHGRLPGAGLVPGAGAAGGTPTASGGSQQGSRGTSRTPGSAANQSSSLGSPRREFTPGGTGLVQGRSPSGTSQPTRQPRRETRNNSQRPDYLREDEKTWGVSRRRTVPPVIE